MFLNCCFVGVFALSVPFGLFFDVVDQINIGEWNFICFDIRDHCFVSSKIFLVQLEEDLLTLLVVPHQLLEVEDEVGEVQEDGIAEGSQLSEASIGTID